MRLLGINTAFKLGLGLCLAISFATLGCSRKAKQETSVQLSLSTGAGGGQNKVGAQSLNGYHLNFIVVNVTGPGISPAFVFEWDGHCGSANCPAAPSTVSFEVPTGSPRIIQVLSVYESESDGDEIVYYGDTEASLNGATASVTVNTSPAFNVSGEVKFVGRYMDGSEAGGPGGILETQFQPPGPRPPMVISRAPVFAGWMSLFTIDGVAFNYKLNGQTIVAGLTPSSPQIAPSTNILAVRVPPSDNTYTDENSNTVVNSRGEQRIRLGFFGPAAGARTACYDNRSNQTLSGLTHAGTATPLFWDGSPAADEAGPTGGGTGYDPTGSGTVCHNSSTEFGDHLVFRHANVKNGSDSIAGFRGPFKATGSTNGSDYLDWSKDGADNVTLTWKLLPGVTSGPFAVAGVAVVVNPDGRQNGIYGDSGIRCTQLEAKDYQKLGSDIPISVGQTEGTTVVAGVSVGAHVVLCPYIIKNGAHQLVDAGVDAQIYASGGGSSYADDFNLKLPSFNGVYTYAHEHCVPVQIEGLRSGVSTNLPSGSNLSLSGDDASVEFYTDSICSAAAPGSVALNGEIVKTLYMKSATSGGPTARVVTATISGTLAAVKTQAITVTDSPGSPVEKVYVRLPSTVYAHTCMPYQLETWHDDGANSVMIVPQGYYSGLTLSGTDLTFWSSYYSDCDPMYPNNSSSLDYSSNYTARGYFKYTGAGITTGASVSNGPSPVGDLSGVTVVQPLAISNIRLSMSSVFEEGKCQTVDVSLRDTNGNVSPALSTLTVDLTPVAGDQFYDGGYCGSPITETEIATGLTSKRISYKAFGVGEDSISAEIVSLSLTGTQNIDVQEPTVSSLWIVLPGQTAGPSSVLGTPTDQPNGAVFNVDLYAMNYDGSIDLGFNGVLSNLSSSYMAVPSAGSVNFTNGQATISVTATTAYAYATMDASLMGVSGVVNGYSTSVNIFAPATQFSVHMNYATTLVPLACQIFTVVPEDANGFAAPAVGVTTVSLSATGGGTIYTDNTCSTPFVSGTFNTSPGSKYYVYFFKDTAVSNPGTIDTMASGYNPVSLATTTAAGGTVGAANQWQLVGFNDPGATIRTVEGRCHPYLGYLADSNGMFVIPGGDITNMRVMMTSISGTTGAFYDSDDCSATLLDVSNITLSAAIGYRYVNANSPAWANGGQRMNVKDMTSTYIQRYLDLWRVP